ncbi:phosphorus acquisition-controlling protein [Histoplasma capsulatum var. duboisii H88]|uniref:Phosphorus acquisition-controlling protein n=1 Tax=Ajellomyces capsulatus (strain H88) TaxID=544711 RepID=F0UL24_AJEC8|nr:phosphorus acquisition-controlling protein [Histoplasma capsulatum var. duboisii H88]QSS56752.1 phosphorus acquisition-controlling protein [Histoplasma capsulatum var. duboisii H88]
MEMDGDISLSGWPQTISEDLLVPVSGEEEFSKYLDFDFSFADLDDVASQQHNAIHTSPPASSEMAHHQQMQNTSQAPNYQPELHQLHHQMCMQGDINTTAANVAPQYYVQKQQTFLTQQNYGQRQYIPPTPNSTEMHAGVPQGLSRLDTDNHRHYEHYARPSDDQSAFTPSLSPAMTPLEQQFCLSEYTVPGEYFTPLTSPALEARNSNGNGYIFNGTTSHTPDMGFISSPVEMANHLPITSTPSSPGTSRKQRAKSSFSNRAGSRLARQSPSVRPLSRRKPSTSGPSVDSGFFANHDKSSSRPSVKQIDGCRHTGSTESSGQDSVSPEPLSEPLMPPPALPRSAKSPCIGAQDSRSEAISREAATPATLMNLQRQSQPTPQNSKNQFSRSGGLIVNEYPDETMEDMSLPEAASSNSELATASSGIIVTSGEMTPKIVAEQTPRLKPANNGSSERPSITSVTPSPQINAMASPTGPVGLKRTDSKLNGRVSKKRQSVSSSQVSPALRPKISPSIQPLIHGDVGINAETSALYLASKSNYQHILEGTLLPGVSYPNALAENLSSKRTNHKLAEQGRRNRINTALKEIESLLPPSLIREREKADKVGIDGGDATTSKSSDRPSSTQTISKASTVEMAIVYIKSLQQEISEIKEKLQAAELKLLESSNKGGGSPRETDEKSIVKVAPNATVA